MNQIRHRRLLRGLSQQQLAEQVKTTRAQIDRLEKGQRRLAVDWLLRLAQALGCEPADLLPPEAASPVRPHDLIPVRSAARGGSDQEMFLTDGPIDHVPRPYYLAHAPEAYAIYVVGESMVPMYRPRQLLFVHPHKPPALQGGVVVYKTSGAVLVKELIRQKETVIGLREYQPQQRDFIVDRSDIREIHSIVGIADP